MAEESAAGLIDVAATPYLKSPGSTGSDAGKMVSASSESQLMVANGPAFGNILVDGRGFTLYMFTKDEAGKSNCAGGCLQVWPPLLSANNLNAGEGVDASLIGSAALPGGTLILTYNGMPLYYFADDNHPGAVNGQGKNDAWFVVSPAGDPIGMQ